MKTKTNKFIIGAVLAASLAFTISSCKKDRDTGNQTASLSFVNTVEGSAAQDVYVDDAKASPSAVAYGSAATNISTTAGTKVVTFKNTGTSTATASATINADVNTSQTVYLYKQPGTGILAAGTYVNESTSVSGKAKVRFINVAPLLTNVINVTTSTGASIISALTFKAASAYQTIDANTALNVTMTGSAEVTTIAGSELQAGKIYTIWFDSTTSTKVKYHIVVEN